MSCGANWKSLSPTYNLISSVLNAITRAQVEKSLNNAIFTDYVQMRIGHQSAAMALIDGVGANEVSEAPFRLPALRTRVGRLPHPGCPKQSGGTDVRDRRKGSEVAKVV